MSLLVVQRLEHPGHPGVQDTQGICYPKEIQGIQGVGFPTGARGVDDEIDDLINLLAPTPRVGTNRKSRNDSDFEKLKSQFSKLTPEKTNELLQDAKAIEKFTQVEKDIGLKIKKSLGEYEDGKWVAKVEPGSSPAKRRKAFKALTRKQRPAVSEEIIMDSGQSPEEDSDSDEEDIPEMTEYFLRTRVQRFGYQGDVSFEDLSEEDLLEKIDNLIRETYDRNESLEEETAKGPPLKLKPHKSEASQQQWSVIIPEKKEDIIAEMSSLKLNRYNYEERDIVTILVLLSWSGTAITESATKLTAAFFTKKMKLFRIASLVPIIVRKIQAHDPSKMRPDGSQLDIILGLLTKGSSELTWGFTIWIVVTFVRMKQKQSRRNTSRYVIRIEIILKKFPDGEDVYIGIKSPRRCLLTRNDMDGFLVNKELNASAIFAALITTASEAPNNVAFPSRVREVDKDPKKFNKSTNVILTPIQLGTEENIYWVGGVARHAGGKFWNVMILDSLGDIRNVLEASNLLSKFVETHSPGEAEIQSPVKGKALLLTNLNDSGTITIGSLMGQSTNTNLVGDFGPDEVSGLRLDFATLVMQSALVNRIADKGEGKGKGKGKTQGQAFTCSKSNLGKSQRRFLE
ncbi:hypothetical protein BOTCAL_0301g00010 [Botryotinia calthae]|uniref:Uncharacterized protein n=1 Tax=Botryotinia calthae TaxID=38488 RepID=A0A4Y8CUB5_9HELO|nr:hypothetical protein BOTCAL_0301g00010 [Botryotinia calthae]